MFEFIGICVVAYVAWRIVKKLPMGIVNYTLSKAVAFAIKHDVPQSFASAVVKNPDIMKSELSALKETNPEVSSLDVYQQYGLTIVKLHLHSVTDKVVMFFRPQIDKLESEGLATHVNDVTFVYVWAVTKSMSNKDLDLLDLKHMVREIFYKSEHTPLIENAYGLVMYNQANFYEKCQAIAPLVRAEIECHAGEFYEKYTRRALIEIEEMFERDDDYDPRTAKRIDLLDL